MIAIDTISATLATIAARLTMACPGAARNCASASAAATWRGCGVTARSHATMRDSNNSVPIRSSAIAA